jgi:hypothetical protein
VGLLGDDASGQALDRTQRIGRMLTGLIRSLEAKEERK